VSKNDKKKQDRDAVKKPREMTDDEIGAAVLIHASGQMFGCSGLGGAADTSSVKGGDYGIGPRA
jgi:hypothetical protein